MAWEPKIGELVAAKNLRNEDGTVLHGCVEKVFMSAGGLVLQAFYVDRYRQIIRVRGPVDNFAEAEKDLETVEGRCVEDVPAEEIKVETARDKARRVVESLKTGDVLTLPSNKDEAGNLAWNIEIPTHAIDVQPLSYYKRE